ncbi:uncharacterized protein [Glycine max]|uniref:uncharacterized protein n=1 Tax=Glycine max TaxID=3847 RepID=UPI0007193951|nr:uncharacterized protein LOC106798239 [Glycine max]|eukprot:XP_014629706.1 uncharacterized protein LOC106798239 [Glycine max]
MPVQPSEQQVKDLKKTQADLWEKATMQESIVRQKSRCRRIKEGDSNTSYFHRVINLRRKRNALRGLQIGDTWVENPNIIKAETFHHFQNRFNEPHLTRPNLDGVSFKSLTYTHREIMIEPFKEEEIRLSKVMNHLIDERQTAFVKGRQLLHGVLIAIEVVEEARRSKRPCRFFSVCGFNPKENLGE